MIQNYNCIDYNNINININNNNNNIIKQYKLTHRRNIDKSNISNNNTNKIYKTINAQKIRNIDNENKNIIFYNSYIKNFYKTNQKNIIEKKVKFQRKHNEKKLTFVENNSDIKNKILNYYLSQKGQNLKLNNRIKNQNKLKFKLNDFELKKAFNTIDVNNIAISKKNNFKNGKK